MTTDPRAGAEDALQPMDTARQAWLRTEKEKFNNPSPGPGFGLAKRAFAAGFAAGLAHAPAAPDPATVAAMRRILIEIRDRSEIDGTDIWYWQKQITEMGLGGGTDGAE